MGGLQLFYFVVGGILLIISMVSLTEKRVAKKGAVLVEARILDGGKPKTLRETGNGGFAYYVEFLVDGQPRRAYTNDSFLFDHSSKVGQMIEIWYKPGTYPVTVERKSPETEVYAVLGTAIGVACLLLGFGVI